MEIAKKFEGLEDDFLVAEFLDVELVEVVHCQIEKALSVRNSEDHVDEVVKIMMLMIG